MELTKGTMQRPGSCDHSQGGVSMLPKGCQDLTSVTHMQGFLCWVPPHCPSLHTALRHIAPIPRHPCPPLALMPVLPATLLDGTRPLRAGACAQPSFWPCKQQALEAVCWAPTEADREISHTWLQAQDCFAAPFSLAACPGFLHL